MELPIELKNLIENELEKANIKDLQKNAENISFKYREKSGKGNRLVTENIEALAYSAVRMPATYSAIYTALKNVLEIYNPKIESVLDVGAGTGGGGHCKSGRSEGCPFLFPRTCLQPRAGILQGKQIATLFRPRSFNSK